MHDLVIIGAGTAGLSAAIYGCRAGKSVLVIEKENFGGQIIFAPLVENYPGLAPLSGAQFSDGLFDQAMKLGMEILLADVTGISKSQENTNWIVHTSDGDEQAKAVILATGASPKRLNLEGEEDLIGNGVSYCALCDGSFYKGRPVAIVGGGNSALEEAEFLASLASKVYLIHRREEFRGEEKLISRIRENPKIEFILNTEIINLVTKKSLAPTSEYISWDNGNKELQSITLRNKETGAVKDLQVDSVFVCIGRGPANGAFADMVELDEKGYIKAGENCETNLPGVYAAGDCRTKEVRQLTTAAADGAVSAKKACKFIG